MATLIPAYELPAENANKLFAFIQSPLMALQLRTWYCHYCGSASTLAWELLCAVAVEKKKKKNSIIIERYKIHIESIILTFFIVPK